MDTEIWKDVPTYEGEYQVGSIRRIKGLERKVISNFKCRRCYPWLK